MVQQTGHVIIGVDPHKLSATIEVVDDREQLLGSGRFTTDRAGYAAMRKYTGAWPGRVWAVEGSNGAGRPLAQRLLESRSSTSPRSWRRGCGCSTPATTARQTRTTLTRSPRSRSAPRPCASCSSTGSSRRCGCSPTAVRHSLGGGSRPSTGSRRSSQNSFQDRPNETSPLARPKKCSPVSGRATSPEKTRRRIAAEELAELVAVEAKIKKSTAELKAIVLARGSHLMDLHGVGPVVAARVLADVGDVTRFADRNRFASWTGTAPLDASSGEQNRHRLSRAGTGE